MNVDGTARRVLISACACAPGQGSEPGTGWTWARAAAEHADVTLLTDSVYEEVLTHELRVRPVPRLTPVYVDVPTRLRTMTADGRRLRLRHAAWQRRALHQAAALHAERPFDVVHHVSWSADWQPVGVARLPDVAFVWGPVGGTCPLPWRLYRQLSRQALLSEVARWAAGAAGRRAFGDRAASRSSVLLCQNHHVAKRFRSTAAGDVTVEPNVALDRTELERALRSRPSGDDATHARRREAVFIGRLFEWKGLGLAVSTLARPEAADWSLTVVGHGPAAARAKAAAERRGVADRVSFVGKLPREQVLAMLARADALLFPSTHEACGWVVAEALSLGCPPVCLNVGGPPVLVERAGFGMCVPVSADPAPALAVTLRDLPHRRPSPTRAFDADRLPELIRTIYNRATAVSVLRAAEPAGDGRASSTASGA